MRVFGGFAIAADGLGNQGDSCRIRPAGACLPPLTFRSYSVLAGLRRGFGLFSLGGGVGAGVYVSSDHVTGGGYQIRGELSTPESSAVALVVTGRRSLLPQSVPEYELSAVTAGVRVRFRD